MVIVIRARFKMEIFRTHDLTVATAIIEPFTSLLYS